MTAKPSFSVRHLFLFSSFYFSFVGSVIVHLTTPQVGTAVDDLKHVVGALFAATDDAGSGAEATPKRPRVLWSLHFNLRRFGREDEAALRRRGVFIGRGPDAELDLDSYVVKVKQTHKKTQPQLQ